DRAPSARADAGSATPAGASVPKADHTRARAHRALVRPATNATPAHRDGRRADGAGAVARRRTDQAADPHQRSSSTPTRGDASNTTATSSPSHPGPGTH